MLPLKYYFAITCSIVLIVVSGILLYIVAGQEKPSSLFYFAALSSFASIGFSIAALFLFFYFGIKNRKK